MKKVFTILFLATATIACGPEDETTPDAVACFDFSPNADVGVGDEVSFSNCSDHATSFAWDFGDGETSTDENPAHVYESAGEFTVKLLASNGSSADTISKTISITQANAINVNGQSYLITSASMDVSNWEDVDEEGNPLVGQSLQLEFAGSNNLTFSIQVTADEDDAFEGTFTANNSLDFEIEYWFGDEDEVELETGTLTISKEDGTEVYTVTYEDPGSSTILFYAGDF